MPQENLSIELGTALSINATQVFDQRINGLMKLLAATNRKPMAEGSVINVFEYDYDLADPDVAPGDVIPLSRVEKHKKASYELAFKKRRKGVPVESVQKYGRGQVMENDDTLIRLIQKDVRKHLIESLATGSGVSKGAGFQAAMANNIAEVRVVFEDDDPSIISFVNTRDVYDYLGTTNIVEQTAFGLTYLEGFMGNKIVFMSGDIPRGTIYSTAVNNLNLYYADTRGAMGDFFDMKASSEGILGVSHSTNYERATYETLVMYAMLWLPENLKGVVVGTIEAAPAPTPTP